MKYLLIIALLASCTQASTPISAVKALVSEEVVYQGMGVVEAPEILGAERLDDSTYLVRYRIDNPATDSPVTMSRVYYFDSGITKIIKSEPHGK